MVSQAGPSEVSANQKGGAAQFARVYDVLLSDSEDQARKFEVPAGSIGTILFKFLTKGVEDLSPILQKALPFDSRVRSFPVKNEIVEIVNAPTKDAQDARTNTLPDYYYKSVVDMWGSSEHNARPNTQFNTSKAEVTGNFVEKGNIGRLLHLPGDFVMEGRFGNAIRFGSSNNKAGVNSPWRGPDSSPLVIISNGKASSKMSFEDVNKDGSSMYILSDQTLPFEPASLNFESYNVNMTAVQQAQVVKTAPAEPVKPAPVSQAELPAKEPAVAAVVTTVVREEVKKDPVEELPDKEPVSTEQFQEYENIRAMHTDPEDAYWKDNISNDPVSTSSTTTIPKDLSDFNLTYLGLQQGAAGLKAILDSASKGYTTVPLKNGYTSEKVQSENMPPNIGRDFGNIPLTPANFLAYWKNKSEAKKRAAFSKPMPPAVEAAVKKACLKWGVPFDIARTICFIESTYDPNATPKDKKSGKKLPPETAKHYGLFQVSPQLWRASYPKESVANRTDIIKNADVGVKYIKTIIGELSAFRRLIR